MTMNTKISTREWEALSAYLDGQLAQKDRARLEARLKDNSDLRAALEEMRRTRLILRSQPRMRAPRNFTLTPAMVGAARKAPAGRWSLFPTMRLASVLASILLVLVLIGDFFAGAPATSSTNLYAEEGGVTAMEMEAPQAAERSVGGEPAQEAAAQAPYDAQESQAAGGAADAQVEAPALPAAKQPGAEEPPMTMMQAPGESTPEGTPDPTQAALDPALASATPGPEALAAALPEATPAAAEPNEGMIEAQQGEVLDLLASPTPVAASPLSPAPGISRSNLRVAEIVLAITALVTGLLAFFLRRGVR